MNLQKAINSTKQQITFLKEQIESKQSEIDDFEKELIDEQYDELLDELYEPYEIGYLTFYASRVLFELDEIAYKDGKSDFADSIELEEFPAYVELTEELEQLQSELEDLESELEDLESEESESD